MTVRELADRLATLVAQGHGDLRVEGYHPEHFEQKLVGVEVFESSDLVTLRLQ